MVSFRALMLQTQRRWKETTGFCLYKGIEPHFNVIIHSHHPLPTRTPFSPLETSSSHSGRNITSTASDPKLHMVSGECFGSRREACGYPMRGHFLPCVASFSRLHYGRRATPCPTPPNRRDIKSHGRTLPVMKKKARDSTD